MLQKLYLTQCLTFQSRNREAVQCHARCGPGQTTRWIELELLHVQPSGHDYTVQQNDAHGDPVFDMPTLNNTQEHAVCCLLSHNISLSNIYSVLFVSSSSAAIATHLELAGSTMLVMPTQCSRMLHLTQCLTVRWSNTQSYTVCCLFQAAAQRLQHT